ncbi:MAG: hypothetical protein ACLPVO_05275 [Desulfomonilaceae bacterium]
MIPKNITSDHILVALKKIDRESVPTDRAATKYHILHENRRYPPKYAISIANEIANGVELKPNEFSGGEEANKFLRKRGFLIVERPRVGKEPDQKTVPQPVSRSVHDSSAVRPETKPPPQIQTDNCNGYPMNPADKVHTKKIVEPIPIPPEDVKSHFQSTDEPHSQYKLATVCVESVAEPSLKQRLELLKDVIAKLAKNVDLFVFPAGFFDTGGKYEKVSEQIESGVCDAIRHSSSSAIACIGVDALFQKDQFGVAFNTDGVLAMAKKFFPTDDEAGVINLASDPFSGESKYPRTFLVKGKRAYLAVCYDSFGIRKKSVKRQNIDLIVNLIHGFNPKGESGSGDVYFAKHGLAGSSKQWGCPTYAAAVFSHRNVSPNWPTGVMWNQGSKSTQEWRYIENTIAQPEPLIVTSSNPNEKAIVRIFSS